MNISLANMNASGEYWDYFKYRYSKNIFSSVTLIICCIGAPLNGIVIWLLGFQIKRNPFTILVLNLVIADFGFLIVMTIFCINTFIGFMRLQILWVIFFSLFNVTYTSGLFLLTAVSIDRCVSVLFPIWHRCSRPKYLSPAVCTFLWIFSSLLLGIHYIMQHLVWNLHLTVTAVLCLPLMTTSTVILFIKICLKSKQMKRGRPLVMILITLLCFLILNLPLYIYLFIARFVEIEDSFGDYVLYLFVPLSASLNSSVNPVIYFLVGRKKRAQSRESIRVIFQRVFREDEAPETR